MVELFGLPLLPLLGGFVFLVRFNRTSIRSYRYSGYKLLFYSAIFGFIGDLVALAIILIYQNTVPVPVKNQISAFPPVALFVSSPTNPYDAHPLLAFAILTTSWLPLNLIFRPTGAAKQAVRELGTYLERLLLEAQEKEMLVAVTLKNRKVYVGHVIEAALSFTSDDSKSPYLVILPVLSGYRDNETLQMKLPVRYYEMWGNEELLKISNLTPDDFTIVLPEGEIVSVNKFDYTVYDGFAERTGVVRGFTDRSDGYAEGAQEEGPQGSDHSS